MKRDDSDEGEGMQTRAVHAGKEVNRTHAVCSPIWMTTSFRADSSEHFAELAKGVRPQEFYTRYGNPTHREAETNIAALEGGEAALLTASGMGAVFVAVMGTLRQGDHVVAQQSLYSGTAALLSDFAPRFGVEVTHVDQTRVEDFAAAVRPNTKLIYTETPTNPLMRLTDLRAVAEARPPARHQDHRRQHLRHALQPATA